MVVYRQWGEQGKIVFSSELRKVHSGLLDKKDDKGEVAKSDEIGLEQGQKK